ncbi:hypothetical protein GUA87_00795 [Sneathiella sp. P13V-1]|uniref:hypothetical protein n=1 Tax=Sneathiella sp. P13V-1 TaxID=2697366 RepID=UPI00187B1DBB|nr:hypothetical protein [Sneathiella sp. P13V-1]MBE7635366.1 hypothetical protein [Sneathiella sp. P13V-1]
MSTPAEIAKQVISNGLQQIGDAGLSEDAFARALINEAIGVARRTRSVSDIASELEFLAENLDEDQEYTFMRP